MGVVRVFNILTDSLGCSFLGYTRQRRFVNEWNHREASLSTSSLVLPYGLISQ